MCDSVYPYASCACVVQVCGSVSWPEADWPSGAPGEFPVVWQSIWPAALHLFIYYILFIYIYIY